VIKEDVEKALDGLRQGFQADGADLQVDAITETSVNLRLVGTEDTCWECIIPSDQLRDVVVSVLSNDVPSISSVELTDPRVSGG
jgi:Fe-S cluster biogenesis protein NfuA